MLFTLAVHRCVTIHVGETRVHMVYIWLKKLFKEKKKTRTQTTFKKSEETINNIAMATINFPTQWMKGVTSNGKRLDILYWKV